MKFTPIDIFLLGFGVAVLIIHPVYWWLGLFIIFGSLIGAYAEAKIERLNKETEENNKEIARILGEHK